MFSFARHHVLYIHSLWVVLLKCLPFPKKLTRCSRLGGQFGYYQIRSCEYHSSYKLTYSPHFPLSTIFCRFYLREFPRQMVIYLTFNFVPSHRLEAVMYSILTCRIMFTIREMAIEDATEMTELHTRFEDSMSFAPPPKEDLEMKTFY